MTDGENQAPKRISGYTHEEACRYIMDLEIFQRGMDEKIKELEATIEKLKDSQKPERKQ